MIYRQKLAALTEKIEASLRFMADAGVSGFDCSEKTLKTIAAWGGRSKPRAETLDEIRLDLGDCHRCALSKTRRHIVFGEGNPHARLIFIGEAPGFDEDRQGKPFVGRAGSLLTKIIGAMGLSREDVYICNILKCRPPDNRDPLPDEIGACAPFLRRQIETVNPAFLCALGSYAARTLLETAQPISRLRGRFHQFRGRKLLPTYHPAYLLRNEDKKRDVWEDIKKLMRAMDDKNKASPAIDS
jgi:uracil-DNA glycosylase family 4